MTLEEAVAQFSDEKSIAVNTVDKNKIIVWETLDTMYAVVVETPDPAFDIYYTFEQYPNLEEVTKHFIGWSFASDINPNAWVLSSRNG